jgi:anti-sigma factor RsiW
MKRLCDLFNQYRDGMLNPEQKKRFESHLAACEKCMPRLFLLNNMVHAIRNQNIPDSMDHPERIADRAYTQAGSWDILLLSWLRPLPVWSGLAVLLIFCAFLWVAPFAGQLTSGSDYEYLLVEGGQGESASANLSDDELENWLEQGGTIK